MDSPVNNSTMVPSGDFVSDGFGLVGSSISGPSSNKSRLVSSSNRVYLSYISKNFLVKLICFFLLVEQMLVVDQKRQSRMRSLAVAVAHMTSIRMSWAV